MSKVTIVIPNYNGKHFLQPCMDALCRQTYTDFDVLIVDNGSWDGSGELIRSLEEKAEAAELPFPVRGILLPENTGFSGAVNAGIGAAEGEYVILLNNDTEPLPGYVGALCGVLEQDQEKRIFAVSPKMIQLYHKELLDDAGDGYNLLGWAFQRGVGQPVTTGRFCRQRQVFSACAGAAIYRRDLLLKLALPEKKKPAAGKDKTALPETAPPKTAQTRTAPPKAAPECFDLQHFAYLEDIDLCYRARIHGYQVLYCPEAEVYHVGSGTSGSRYNAFKVRLAARNNVYLNYKNMPLLQLCLNLPGILLGVLIKQIFFARIGFGREYRQGFLEGIRTLPECRKTPFSMGRLPNYLRIEGRLVADTFSYAGDFLWRRLNKLKKETNRDEIQN